MKGIKKIMYKFLKEIFKRFYINKNNDKIIHKKYFLSTDLCL